MKNPFKEFTYIMTAQELLDFAFNKASKKFHKIPRKTSGLEVVMEKEINRLEQSTKALIEKIQKIIKSVPNIDELPVFYRQLSNILVDNDELRKNLGRINGVIPVLHQLKGQYIRVMRQQLSNKQCAHKRIEFFGRLSSVISKLNSSFIFLEECRNKLKEIPPINLQLPNVVVAGYPNVGKSTLVGKISTAQPHVSAYPFTTKQIYIGMYKDQIGSEYFQVIDTPGILDRPMRQRNEIEKQAILALNTIATLVLFVFDPTITSGYEVQSQIELFDEIKTEFLRGLNIPVKIVINKADLATEDEINTLLEGINKKRENVILVSAQKGDNVQLVLDYLLQYFKDTNYQR